MEVQFGPSPVDEPTVLYKLQRKIKVFNPDKSLPNRGYNLVTSSSKYGIVFVGSPDVTLSVYHLKDLIDNECEPLHLAVKLHESPTHIAVSCDEELLAATGKQLLCVYKVLDFMNGNPQPAVAIPLDVNPSTFVSALQWNPCIPDNIAIAFYDGTLLVSSVSSNQVKKVQAAARCICWSPKGKQLVTGNSDGSLCQYKPDLTLAKRVPPPNLFEVAQVEALAIHWISTFQFAIVFRNAADNSRPLVTIVNTPKAGQPSCLNYEDICYSMGSNRPWYYYLQGLAPWNMILASSSNSMEIATLGSTDGVHWIQWCQTDEARPELPLTDKKVENYPVGICIDTCAIHQLPWGENETLPHMPMLLVVSQSGLLTIFNIINLNKTAPQVCIPPPQLSLLALPQGAMTSVIPGEAPIQVTLPPPPPPSATAAAPKPQPQQTPVPQPPAPQSAHPAFSSPTFGQVQTASTIFRQDQRGQEPPSFGQSKPFGQPQQTPAFSTAPAPSKQPEPPKAEIKVAPAAAAAPVASQPAVVPPPKPQPAQTQPPSGKASQASEVNAALKAEQEKMNRLKADQELKSMLVKEVNDFQMELYKFVVKNRQVQNKLQQDLNAIDANFNFQALDAARLQKQCDLEELRTRIVQLKLELVRTCAVLAEARAHAEAKDLHQWTQIDPLTSKRLASVKNLAYYVQTQLEQAHKALDYKWLEMLNNDLQYNKAGHRMIRPILDDVYQPLVKQQEILSRQQAVLRTLKNTLKEVDPTPMFKSTSLLRSTPFRNKDPLSKLTKNILNMSIETQTKSKELLTPQKLDALRDMLSNHKPTKIKPVNVELRQHLAQMRISYEKSVKERAQEKPVPVKSNIVQPLPSVKLQTQPLKISAQPVKIDNQPTVKPSFQPAAPTNAIKSDLIAKQPQTNVPSSIMPMNQTAKPGLNNVARTLFSDESNKSSPQSISVVEVKPAPTFGFAPPTSISASPHTKSILKDMLQNKQANQEAKNDANTFMGQKICSPSAFAFSTVSQAQPQSTPPQAAFISKPITDINNMFNKFTPQSFAPETKPQTQRVASAETGEPVKIDTQAENKKKEEKPASTFQLKIPTPVAASTPASDVLKINQATTKTEKAASKLDESKENIPEKPNENIAPIKFSENTAPVAQKTTEGEKKDSVSKAFSFGTNKTTNLTFGLKTATSEPLQLTEQKEEIIPQEPKKEMKPESVKEEKLETPTSSSASTLFAAANVSSPTAAKPQPVFGTAASSPQTSIFSSPASMSPVTSIDTNTTKESTPTTVTSAASSLFATAAASQPFEKTTQPGSIFSAASSASTGFTPTQGSIFESTTTTTSSPSVFGTSTAQSIFSGAETKPTVFSTPIPASPAAVFGAAASTAATTGQTLFGSTTADVFGSTTTQAPTFGSGSVFNTVTSQTAFATATTTTAQSVFGANTPTTQSVFGSSPSPSIFGQAAATTQASVFGSPATTAQSVFGTPTATTHASIFGGSSPTTQQTGFGATSTASVFGSPTPSTQAVFGTSTTPQTSIFGTPTTSPSSVFGTPAQTTQASVFGAQPTTTTGGSLFGGTDNLFAAASISTTSAGSPPSGGNIFGGGSPGGSVFASGGSTTNVFGGKSSFSQSNPQAAAIFGGASSTAFSQKTATPPTNFWSGGGATGGTGFGSTAFGQQATTQASSIFGGSTGGSFSSPSGGHAFGSPQQQTSVFGSPQQQAAPGFGGSPVFGNKPAFGQPAAFGSPTAGGFGGFGGLNKSPGGGFGAPASFGGAPAFGGSAFGGSSPGKMFGAPAAAAQPSFGATPSNSTFEQLANQNTLTFGNLAQQTTQQPQPAPTFNTSPSFTGWRS